MSYYMHIVDTYCVLICAINDGDDETYIVKFVYLFIYLFIVKIVHVVQQSKRAIKLIRMQRDLTNSKLTILTCQRRKTRKKLTASA